MFFVTTRKFFITRRIQLELSSTLKWKKKEKNEWALKKWKKKFDGILIWNGNWGSSGKTVLDELKELWGMLIALLKIET